MFAGHAGLALLVKGKRPTIALGVLVPVAFGPDWIELAAAAFGHQNRQISHSLISVGIGSTVVALIYFAVLRARVDAVLVWATYVSHWPADFITGHKPTWPGGPTLGLGLYDHPLGDLIVEIVVVVVCWLVYRASLPQQSRRRAINFLVPLGLAGMQVLFEAINNPDFGTRELALEQRGSHLPGSVCLAPHGSCKGRLQTQPERIMPDDTGPIGLVTLICITCGNEKFYDTVVPNSVKCDKCGGTVFRNFATPTEPDDATVAQLEEQARSISYGDSSPDTSAGDIRDLDGR